MSILPTPLTNLIDGLGQLPGVGPRTAERYAFHILKAPAETNARLAHLITALNGGVKYCPVTFMLIDADQEVSPLYNDSSRDRQLIALVEQPLDVVAIEKTLAFKGVYHVLGGVISPIDGIGPAQLHIEELETRIKADKVKELILATNASVEGESTALYLQKLLKEKYPKLKITRLARGIPSGVDIEYADQMTLLRALENRQSL